MPADKPAAKPPVKAEPKEVKVLPLDRQLTALRFSPCGRVLAAAAHDGTVRRWDADSLASLPPLTGHHGWATALAFSPDKKHLATADSWGRLTCWPHAEAAAQPVWAVEQAHDGWLRAVAASPDGKLFATCGRDGALRLWDAATGAKRVDLAVPGADLYALTFTPDGKGVLAGDLRGDVRHWDLATGRLLRTLDARALYFFERLQDVGGVRILAFDPAGRTLAVAGSQPKSGGFVQGTPALLLFDSATGRQHASVRIGTENDGFVHDLHWHPEGYLILATSGQPGQGKVALYRPGEAAPFFVTAKMPNCHAVAMHPDGRRLAVAATNANSAGNGRQLDKNKEYPGNASPVHLWELPPFRG